MTIDIIITFVNILSTVLVACIIIRALMSWFAPGGGNQLVRVLSDVTEPVLAPIRRALPPVGGIDFSPLLALILIQVLDYMITRVLASAT